MTLTGILIRVLLIVTLIMGVGALGGFRLPNGLIYDGLVRLTPSLGHETLRVILIEAKRSRKGDGEETWSVLLRKLRELNPEKILFTFVPERVGDRFFREAAADERIIFGIPVAGDAGDRVPPSVGPGAVAGSLRQGVATLPPGFHGIHRTQYRFVPANGGTRPSLEAAGAGLAVSGSRGEKALFRVNFNGWRDRVFPRLSLERALQGEIIPELITGKIVMVGFRSEGPLDRVNTPLSPHAGISPLEFHGHATETLLHREPIREIHPAQAAVAVVAVVILVFVMADRLSLRMFFWAAVPIAGIYLLGIWAALLFLLIWLPATEILLAHTAIFLYLYRQKSVRQEMNVRRMLLETSARLRKRIFPVSFQSTEEHWSQVVAMVTQTLDLTRTIFLERVPRDHRVREVKAWNCSLSDIHERRRDYKRHPYSTAIKGTEPEKMEDRLFFTHPMEDEDQYLVPLSFGGQVLGFWAYGVSPKRVRGVENFHRIVAGFAGQVGELLYRREQARKREHSRKRRILHRFASRDLPGNELSKAIELLNRRLTLQERVFDGVRTAIILYDIFGRVVQVNGKMSRLLRRFNIIAYEMTAKDLAVALARLPEDRIRGILRRVILSHEEATLQVDLNRKGEKNGRETGMLHIRPLLSDLGETDAIEGYPFETFGILFELYELTAMQRSHRLKLQLLTRLQAQLCRDFSPIVVAHDLLHHGDLDARQRRRVDSLMCNKIDSMLMFLRQLRFYMGRDFFFNTRQRYPIDPREPLVHVTDQLREKALEQRVSFRMDLPDFIDMALVDPDELTELILSILEVLIDDSIQGSEIRIDLVAEEQYILYSFSGAGYGMPDETFQRYLFDEEYEAASPQFAGLRNALERTGQWSGILRATSEVGTGMRFLLKARRLFFDDRELIP